MQFITETGLPNEKHKIAFFIRLKKWIPFLSRYIHLIPFLRKALQALLAH